MNRKRKSTEILAQLGEPLPLPYRAHNTGIKSEFRRDEPPTIAAGPAPIVYEPIRKKRLFERREVLGNRDLSFEAPTNDDHVPLPIWRRDRGVLMTSAVSESDTEENLGVQGTILDDLQQQLDLIKTLYDSKDAIEADKKKLDKILASLQQLAEQKQQESIVHELERIQSQSRASSVESSKWKYAFWVLALFFLLLASFLAGQHSYEYCYYFC